MKNWMQFVFIMMGLSTLAQADEKAHLAGLSPEALRCYAGVFADPRIFTNNRKFSTAMEIEKQVVSLCTYSDLEGATQCYQQADQDSEVYPFSKQFSNILTLEKKYARLCSNSGGQSKNAETGDIDAIDCFKTVATDSRLLTQLKEYNSPSALEENITKLCISSNGRGAKECILNSYVHKNEILANVRGFTSPTTLDMLIIDLCKGTRKR